MFIVYLLSLHCSILVHSMAAEEPTLIFRSNSYPKSSKNSQTENISHRAAVCMSFMASCHQNFLPSTFISSSISLLYCSHNHHQNLALSSNVQTHKHHQMFLPQLKESRYASTSYDGWLLTLPFDRKQNLYLSNPFARDRIKLGTAQGLRVVTSISPLDPKCVVLDIHK